MSLSYNRLHVWCSRDLLDFIHIKQCTKTHRRKKLFARKIYYGKDDKIFGRYSKLAKLLINFILILAKLRETIRLGLRLPRQHSYKWKWNAFDVKIGLHPKVYKNKH